VTGPPPEAAAAPRRSGNETETDPGAAQDEHTNPAARARSERLVGEVFARLQRRWATEPRFRWLAVGLAAWVFLTVLLLVQVAGLRA